MPTRKFRHFAAGIQPEDKVYFGLSASPDERGNVIYLADKRIAINTTRHTVKVDGCAVHLSHAEFNILQLLANQSDRAVSQSELYEGVWGYAANGAGPMLKTLKIYVQRLRKKLGEDLADPKLGALRTVRGIGHKAVSSVVSDGGDRPICYPANM